MSKVQLQIHVNKKEKVVEGAIITSAPISWALPFYRCKPGSYVHRVRYGKIFRRHGAYSHTAFTFWCGQNGFLGNTKARTLDQRRGELFSDIPEQGVMCATCAGRAVGAGCDGTYKINGQLVRYQPRERRGPNKKLRKDAGK